MPRFRLFFLIYIVIVLYRSLILVFYCCLTIKMSKKWPTSRIHITRFQRYSSTRNIMKYIFLTVHSCKFKMKLYKCVTICVLLQGSINDIAKSMKLNKEEI